ncbi:helix-turn-helix domain-containing protein [Nocardioides sp. SR21]|uniref:helix-turn-helix domain-containing protein n=1 Tax=Nocardioides sp. SR21 TaxID=2919501 RepID=UPI001FAB31F3|nr:helix-turn-helix domain-containing protein [Nocardioides sp. SR21]
MSDRTWHSTSTAADYADCHPVTVLKACEAEELHGVQRKARGRWRIHVDCLDAWIKGQRCEHQKAGAA